MKKKTALALGLVVFAGSLSGCLSHAVRVEPITVAPVQVTMDVNLHVDDDRGGEIAGDAGPADAAAPAPVP